MPNRMFTTAWEILDAWKWRFSTVLQHAYYIADQSLSLERGAITSQLGGRSAVAVTFHSLRRLRKMTSHPSLAPMAGLAGGGAAVAGRALGRNCTGMWIKAGVGGG